MQTLQLSEDGRSLAYSLTGSSIFWVRLEENSTSILVSSLQFSPEETFFAIEALSRAFEILGGIRSRTIVVCNAIPESIRSEGPKAVSHRYDLIIDVLKNTVDPISWLRASPRLDIRNGEFIIVIEWRKN